jgi:hypothetical protein
VTSRNPGPAVPSVGRIVHYVSRGSADGRFPSVCRAAVVTEVGTEGTSYGVTSLCVLNPTGIFFDESVPQDESNVMVDGVRHWQGGTWHWPERV